MRQKYWGIRSEYLEIERGHDIIGQYVVGLENQLVEPGDRSWYWRRVVTNMMDGKTHFDWRRPYRLEERKPAPRGLSGFPW